MPRDWAEFVEAFGPLVYRCAWRILRHRQEVEDVVQDVFLTAWSDPNLHEVENIGGWLRSVTAHRSLDRLRKRTPVLSAELDLRPDHGSISEVEHLELCQLVRQQVAALPDQQRLAYSLRYFEEMSNPEIAEQLNMTATAVSTCLHTARQSLAETLAPVLRGDDL